MSLLFVSYDNSKPEGDRLTQVELDTVAVNTVYDRVISAIAKFVDDADYLDKAEADLFLENVSFTDLSDVNFNRAYELLIDACNKHNSLKPYKAKLDKAFKTDPRYKAPNYY